MFAADSSVAIASTLAAHAFHGGALAAVLSHRPVLAGHAAFETLSVLTRFGPDRLLPRTAALTLADNFGEPCWPTLKGTKRVYALLGEHNIVGGAVYDALVAQAALDNARTLLSLDRRAEATYVAVGVQFELLV